MTTISHSTTKPHDGLWVLFAVCLAVLTLPLSFSEGAIATPAIGRALGGSAASLTWITNAFMLTFDSLLMAAGALADRFGRKRRWIRCRSLTQNTWNKGEPSRTQDVHPKQPERKPRVRPQGRSCGGQFFEPAHEQWPAEGLPGSLQLQGLGQ